MSKILDKESHAAALARVDPERRAEVLEKVSSGGEGDGEGDTGSGEGFDLL